MKRFVSIIMTLLLFFSLCGCCLNHEWADATCTEPKTCTKCGETEGEPLGHKWVDATCTKPKTCSVCGETEGEPLGHTWEDATCTEPKTCSICGKTEGKPINHEYEWTVEKEATYLDEGRETGVCKFCGDTTERTLDMLKAEYHWNTPIELGGGLTAEFYTEDDDYCFRLTSDTFDTMTLLGFLANGTIPDMRIMAERFLTILDNYDSFEEAGDLVYLTMAGYGREWIMYMDHVSTDSGIVGLKVNSEREMIACSPYHEILE